MNQPNEKAIEEIVEQLRKNNSLDPQRIYHTGHVIGHIDHKTCEVIIDYKEITESQFSHPQDHKPSDPDQA